MLCVYQCWGGGAEENVGSLGAGVAADCGCWEPNSDHLEEQQELLTGEPSPQPPLPAASPGYRGFYT